MTILDVEVDSPQLEVTIDGVLVLEIDPIGIQGPKGDPGSSGLLKMPFAYGDASPIVVTSITGFVFTAAIVITTPFNGIGAALRLGDAVQSDRLMNAAQNNPAFAAEYETNPGYGYTSATQLLFTITPGAGATQGAGYVLLEV
ncbi:MAG: hypothetical protein KME45_03540 [Stenomitos rutilans HA7619-LM2]|nr:hypothetical protein [Stenomitos rutilans HA7619-LM2]MBW4469459.1 hypothetical protein [Stenomitos rutilans HA7619-LM2]